MVGGVESGLFFKGHRLYYRAWTLDATLRHALPSRMWSNWIRFAQWVEGCQVSTQIPLHLLFCWCSPLLFLQNESLNSGNGHFIPLPPLSPTALTFWSLFSVLLPWLWAPGTSTMVAPWHTQEVGREVSCPGCSPEVCLTQSRCSMNAWI